jgi:hypothetical protein
MISHRTAMGTIFDEVEDHREEPVVERIDGFSILVDWLCIVGGMACLGALLWGANIVIAGLIERHPEIKASIRAPWVAPVMIAAFLFVLAGTAALLIFAAPVDDGDER